jgi:hypothetical protein
MSRGFVDPTITPNSVRASYVLAAIRARPGLSLHRLHRDRGALRLTGPNIHVTVASLSSLSMDDLEAPSRTNRK